MRVSELLAAARRREPEASYLTCTGKGDKQRIVPIGDEAADWVEKYAAIPVGAPRQRKCPPF
jgi:site-specific recombinase XerD